MKMWGSTEWKRRIIVLGVAGLAVLATGCTGKGILIGTFGHTTAITVGGSPILSLSFDGASTDTGTFVSVCTVVGKSSECSGSIRASLNGKAFTAGSSLGGGIFYGQDANGNTCVGFCVLSDGATFGFGRYHNVPSEYLLIATHADPSFDSILFSSPPAGSDGVLLLVLPSASVAARAALQKDVTSPHFASSLMTTLKANGPISTANASQYLANPYIAQVASDLHTDTVSPFLFGFSCDGCVHLGGLAK